MSLVSEMPAGLVRHFCSFKIIFFLAKEIMRIYDCNEEVGSPMDLLKVNSGDFTNVIEWCKITVYTLLGHTWLIAFFLSMCDGTNNSLPFFYLCAMHGTNN